MLVYKMAFNSAKSIVIHDEFSLLSTVDPHLSELIGHWVCSDNQKDRIIEVHTIIYKTSF